jgi:hypothetical protein
MSKDDEDRPATSEAWVYLRSRIRMMLSRIRVMLSRIRVMLRRLACEQIEPAFHYRRVA